MQTEEFFEKVSIADSEIRLRDVDLNGMCLLEEVRFFGKKLNADTTGKAFALNLEQSVVKITITEANLNRVLQQGLAGNAELRDVGVKLYPGKARVGGKYMKIIPIPFDVEVVPKIENGVRIRLALLSVYGMELPRALVTTLERVLGTLALDLSGLPFPIWLDEARCDPGRLTIEGRVRIVLPLPDTLSTLPAEA